jgi:predicted transcriptional regulator
MGKRIFGELELSILRILKQNSSPLTVRDVLDALGREDKYTTVMTVMNRLVVKGELLRIRDGQSYRYSTQTQQPRFSLFEKWRQKIFGGKSALMISYLLESGQDITEEELTEIEKIISTAKTSAKRKD